MSTEILDNKDYLVLNYDRSPIVITTKHENITIKPGADFNPSMIPLELSDIEYLNHTTNLFKNGMLWFEKDVENAMYEHLRIRDYDDILTNQEIEDMILNPTAEKLERILSIEDKMYFARIYGVYIGLKNAGASISMDIVHLMSARLSELRDRKWQTSIRVRDVAPAEDARLAEIDALKKQIEEQSVMMAKMQSLMEQLATTKPTAKEEPVQKPAVKKSPAKKAVKATPATKTE